MPRNSASGGLATTISDRATFERADDGRSHRPDHAREARLTAAWSSRALRLRGGRTRRLREDHRALRMGRGRSEAIRLDHARRPAQRPGAPGCLDRPRPGRGSRRSTRGVFDALSAPRPSISNVVVPRLVQSLGERERPFVLVLDDVHALHDPEAFSPLIAMAQHLPPGSQLALAARSEPPMRFARLRAQGRLVELHAHDLVMTRSEASRLLRACGVELGPGALKRLIERTEGWPVALYLAALSLDGEDDLDLAARAVRRGRPACRRLPGGRVPGSPATMTISTS